MIQSNRALSWACARRTRKTWGNPILSYFLFQPKTRSSLLLHSRIRWHDYNHLLIGVYLLHTSIDVRKIVCSHT